MPSYPSFRIANYKMSDWNTPGLKEALAAWYEQDFAPCTRKQIDDLVAKHDEAALSKLLMTRIAFGTAGLRGRMQAGFSSMNPVTVLAAAQALAHVLLEADPENAKRGVVVGYDGRFNSRRYASLTAAAFLQAGFEATRVFVFPCAVPTPLVPFCISHLGCSAGVVITASHNPAPDNGFKVYAANSAQIIPPFDEKVHARIVSHPNPDPVAVALVNAAEAAEARTAEALGLPADTPAHVVRTHLHIPYRRRVQHAPPVRLLASPFVCSRPPRALCPSAPLPPQLRRHISLAALGVVDADSATTCETATAADGVAAAAIAAAAAAPAGAGVSATGVSAAYVAYCRELVGNCTALPARPVTYTAVHGVGGRFVNTVLAACGLSENVHITDIHQTPDPTFPTTPFPNPEEGAGVLAEAIKVADAKGCDLILANDPDADRLGVAERVDGKWRVFSGNEIALLLAHASLGKIRAAAAAGDAVAAARPFAVFSTVSSHILQAMGKVEGFDAYETLTGFKWIGNKVAEVSGRATGNVTRPLVVGFEVEIGFLVGHASLDKDGIRTLAILLQLYRTLPLDSAAPQTLTGLLQVLRAKYGVHEHRTSYFQTPDPASQPAVFDYVRTFGGADVFPLPAAEAAAAAEGKKIHAAPADRRYPGSIGGLAVLRVRDLEPGFAYDSEFGEPDMPIVAGNRMMTFFLEGGAWTTLRGSGTEPKLKWYCESVAADSEAAKASAAAIVKSIADDLVRAPVLGLAGPRA